MGSLFRSEEMCRAQLFLQSEAAYPCVAELGELGLVQFVDLNQNVSAFQRKFVNEVRRCDELERKLRYCEKEVNDANIPITDPGVYIPAPAPREMIDLEATLEKIEVELREVNSNHETLMRNYLELTEHKHVLRNTHQYFEEAESYHHELEEEDARPGYQQFASEEGDIRNIQSHVKLGFIAGVISRERVPSFEQMLWRVCRGNVFIRHMEMDELLQDPHTGNEVHKHVFIVFYQGDQLALKVKKICEGFRANMYPCPQNPSERKEMATGVAKRVEDLNRVLLQTAEHRERLLKAAATTLPTWYVKVCKLKAIYHTLNMFNLDVTAKCLIAECWCPVQDLGRIQLALQHGTERSGATVPSILHRVETKQDPPTFHKTNKFTVGFQNIVDAYGIASYREVNPAPYTIISFPFLFAVMFGDAGHGLIMAIFGLWMVIFERRIIASKFDNEVFTMIFGGRYIVTLMGLFSIYCGFIYNDIFSKSMNIFGSSWNVSQMALYDIKQPDGQPLLDAKIDIQIDPVASYSGEPYPFGMDPIWMLAQNKLNFLNSFKMRSSIFFGVMQMFFGVCLSLVNHICFRRYANIFLEFIPQVIFLMSLFGYLVALIFIKWFTYDASTSDGAPSLIVMFIDMFMGPVFGRNAKPMYNGQEQVENGLLLMALLSVPYLFFAKPMYQYFQHRATKRPQVKPNPGYSHLVEDDATTTATATGSIATSSNLRRGGDQDDEARIIIETPTETTNGTHPAAQQDTEQAKQQLGESMGSEEGTSSMNSSTLPPGELVDTNGMATVAPSHKEEEFDLGEELVHHSIETIEYCLGCISNTASYLRLWALSLAHAELSDVLWYMVMRQGTAITEIWGFILMFGVFAGWATMTVAILLVMEGLSAFLHALRLHWVEFQNKFYKGEGYQFVAFSFETILETKET